MEFAVVRLRDPFALVRLAALFDLDEVSSDGCGATAVDHEG